MPRRPWPELYSLADPARPTIQRYPHRVDPSHYVLFLFLWKDVIQRSQYFSGRVPFSAMKNDSKVPSPVSEKSKQIINFVVVHFSVDCCIWETALVAESRYI